VDFGRLRHVLVQSACVRLNLLHRLHVQRDRLGKVLVANGVSMSR
jgi:hypothetical protein